MKTKRIGQKMQAVVDYVAAHPGATKLEAGQAAWGSSRQLRMGYLYGPVNRAIEAAIEAEFQAKSKPNTELPRKEESSKRAVICEPSGNNASYLRTLYDGRDLLRTVEWCARKLEALKSPDGSLPTIVHRGNSGAAVAWPLVMMTGATSVVVNKPGVKRHGDEVEGHYLRAGERMRFVFVDDFIASGNTLKEVCAGLWKMQSWHFTGSTRDLRIECVGVIQYHESATKHTFLEIHRALKQVPQIRFESVVCSIRAPSTHYDPETDEYERGSEDEVLVPGMYSGDEPEEPVF